MGGKQAVGRQLHAVAVFSGRELSSAYTSLSLSLSPSLSLWCLGSFAPQS